MYHTNLPKVSIVILAYNAVSTLNRIFDEAVMSALTQDYSNYEVIIVDNGSRDSTYEYAKTMYGNRAKVVKLPRNYGYCLGNNLSLKYIDKDSKYILFQNSDAILARDYVRKLIEILEQNPDVAAAQGLEIQPPGNLRIGGSLNTAGYSVDVLPQLRSNNLLCLENLFAFGAALLVRRNVFEIVGGFPSEYFLYYDEADLGMRFRALGFRVFGCSHTSYVHFVQGTASKLRDFNPIVLYFSNRNRLLTVLRYFYGWYLAKALVLNIIIMLIHFIKGSAIRRRIILRIITTSIKGLGNTMRARKTWVPHLKRGKVLEKFIKPWPRGWVSARS
jgi:GT2 family glycosyltransferase